MTTVRTPRACVPTYRSAEELVLREPHEHAYELADWMQRASLALQPVERQAWDRAYSWLRVTSGLRAISFDMAYDDGGMCAGGDFDFVWSEMMNEWQLHQVRLGYAAVAIKALVRALQLPGGDVSTAVAAAETDGKLTEWTRLVHARPLAEHLGGHLAVGASEADAPVSVAVRAALEMHGRVAAGEVGVPEPEEGDDTILPAGHELICVGREATSALLLGGQVLLAGAVGQGAIGAPDEDKYLLDGMWIRGAAGDPVWVDEEISYKKYLAFLHLEPGEPPLD
ncbi:hypothetical protein D7231_14940 [Streptomyces klenkii]|uniref:Uncharacterized protein n=1 Tax=Streptomyces klenkii TaxID=1420899 RepID=A0A3B0BMX4_9ACTN|nr:hypothetical protein [Streptomyces klenkii]RKN72756.1 hypothetical protein D7231_14940 [Streptomyces klenkii]